MREEIYSPLRLWTEEARKASPLAQGQSTRFSAILRIYMYIRVVLKEDPATIEAPFGKLRTDAGTWGTSEEGKGDGSWYSRAVAEYSKL